MKRMKSSAGRGITLNELIFTLRVNTAGQKRRLKVDIANCEDEDLPFLRAIAHVVAAWYKQPRFGGQ